MLDVCALGAEYLPMFGLRKSLLPDLSIPHTGGVGATVVSVCDQTDPAVFKTPLLGGDFPIIKRRGED